MGQTNYSTAKSGLIGMTKTLSLEWARFKVNINCVAFGLIETRLTQATEEKKSIPIDGNETRIGLLPQVAAQVAAAIPLGRAGTTQEAANCVYLFLHI